MMRFLTILITIYLFSANLFAQDYGNLIKNAGDADKYPGSDIIVIFDSTVSDVQETGLSYVTMHTLTKILTKNGAKNYAHQNFNYDPLSADIEIISAKIYRKDGSVEIIDSSDIIDYAAPARMIYWGARNKTVNFGRLEPGDALETVVFRKGFTYALLYNEDDEKFIPPMRGHFYDIVNFWSNVPVLEKVYKVMMPEDKPLQYEVYNGELRSYIHFPQSRDTTFSVEVNPHKKTGGVDYSAWSEKDFNRNEKVIYCWSKKNIQPFQTEPDMVAASDVAPKLLLSTAQDWYAKAVWFHGVNEDFGSFEVTPEVQEKTDELLSGVTDEMEKIKILTHWTAEEIRYSGLSMGEGEGYTLHKGEMTFLDRCGVCKDKAGMLVTMLRAAGFKSYPAMTMAGSRIDRIPADQFNHSVTVAQLENGNLILLDPTWVPGVRELWSSAEQQQQYLMGIPGGSDIMTTPVSHPENHYWKLNGKSRINENGDLTGELILTAEGQTDALIRRVFNRSYKSSRDEYISEQFYRFAPQAEIISSSYSDPDDISEPFQMKIRYKIDNYAKINNEHIIFKPLLAANPFSGYYMSSELALDTSLTERKYGFRIRSSKFVEISEEITLPGFEKALSVPEFNDIESDVADFSSEYEISGNKVKFNLKHTMEKRIYEAEDWHIFKNALQQRHKAMTSEVILKR